MNLTPDEIERYAPYHTMCAFRFGFEDYLEGHRNSHHYSDDDCRGQAYDRGAECAMRRQNRRAG